MKLLVSGSRTIKDNLYVYQCLNKIAEKYGMPSEIIHGDAPGVDRLAASWGRVNHIKVTPRPAKWEIYGRKAGYVRNSQMVKECDKGVCLWDGKSKGTKHTMDLLYKAGKLLKEVLKTPLDEL